MRTTVTLDPDTEAIIRRLMREKGVQFKTALNDAIRAGVKPARRRPTRRTRTFAMGEPTVPLDRALRLAGEFEDEELMRRLGLRK